MKTTKVLETNITETNINEVSKILNFSSNNRVAICNANTLVRSVKDLSTRNLINNFTIKTPDGFPVAKALTFLTKEKFSRVDGYKVFLQTITDGLDTNRRHFFFGNNENTTQQMIEKLKEMFPNIKISGHVCPEQMDAEELAIKYKEEFQVLMLILYGSLLVFQNKNSLLKKYDAIDTSINFVGIGGVFDWVAGTKKKAPEWLANMGLEWLLRLVQDPKKALQKIFN